MTNEAPAFCAGQRLDHAIDALAKALRAAGLGDDAKTDARHLGLAATGLDRADLLRNPGFLLDEAAAARLGGLAARRLAREPVTRILGQRGFWSLDLVVAPDALDPRPDTETLIEAAFDLLGPRKHEPLRILDLGTGSGAILLALLAEFTNASGIGVDLSPGACALARRNAAACGLAARAKIREGSWFDGLGGPFDLIVSNPPYIPTGDIAGLDPEVRDYDPHLALDGGPDGLAAYRTIAARLPDHLAPEGLALFEIGIGQADDVGRLLSAAGLTALPPRRDLAGIIRVLGARKHGDPQARTPSPGVDASRAISLGEGRKKD